MLNWLPRGCFCPQFISFIFICIVSVQILAAADLSEFFDISVSFYVSQCYWWRDHLMASSHEPSRLSLSSLRFVIQLSLIYFLRSFVIRNPKNGACTRTFIFILIFFLILQWPNYPISSSASSTPTCPHFLFPFLDRLACQ